MSKWIIEKEIEFLSRLQEGKILWHEIWRDRNRHSEIFISTFCFTFLIIGISVVFRFSEHNILLTLGSILVILPLIFLIIVMISINKWLREDYEKMREDLKEIFKLIKQKYKQLGVDTESLISIIEKSKM